MAISCIVNSLHVLLFITDKLPLFLTSVKADKMRAPREEGGPSPFSYWGDFRLPPAPLRVAHGAPALTMEYCRAPGSSYHVAMARYQAHLLEKCYSNDNAAKQRITSSNDRNNSWNCWSSKKRLHSGGGRLHQSAGRINDNLPFDPAGLYWVTKPGPIWA